MSSKAHKRPKDPNAPKKSQSSYFIFSNERRSILQAENKDKKITEISKLISAEWKAMDDDQKKTYEVKAAELKKEYNEKLEIYKQTENYKNHQIKLKQWQENEKNLGRSRKKKKGGPKKPKQPESMPKRPQSSYFIFSNKRRTTLRTEYPDKKITELSKLISSEWNIKTPEEKQQYESQAEVNKKRYNEEITKYKETTEYSEYQEKLSQYKIEKKAWDKSADMDVDSDDDVAHVSMPRKPKDKNCPKRPLTSYFLYAKKVRSATKEEFPSLKITEIAKEISKKWQAMNDDEKKPYIEEAATLKEAYNKEIEAYKVGESAKEFKKKLEAWKEECEKRKREATQKQIKKRQMMAKKNRKSPPKKKGKKMSMKNKKTRRYESDSSEDSDSDSSGSSSDSDSDSDSDSSMSSSSGSDSSGSSSSR